MGFCPHPAEDSKGSPKSLRLLPTPRAEFSPTVALEESGAQPDTAKGSGLDQKHFSVTPAGVAEDKQSLQQGQHSHG